MDRNITHSAVKFQFETSLRNLKLEKVDLLYLHAPDAKTPIEVTLEAVQKLYEQGKFKELVRRLAP
jgi:aflatoxin B1 aldehyde reductase